jgi:predicted RNA binding protein YcfA (HicA-like mRNA interferase family)
MPTAKVRDVIRRLEREGWRLVRQRGDHRHFKHPDNPNIITVSGKSNEDMRIGTYEAIRRKAGWK